MIVGFLLGVLFVSGIVVGAWWGYSRRPVAPPTTATITTADAVATVTLTPPTPPPPTVVRTERSGQVTLPDDVVAACISEARGNHAVLERSLNAAAELVAQGTHPSHVVQAVQLGEQEPA